METKSQSLRGEESDDGGEHTNELYYPPPKPKKAKGKPKKAKVKIDRTGPVTIITDLVEWERLLRDVPLKTGEIRFYRGPMRSVSFQ